MIPPRQQSREIEAVREPCIESGIDRRIGGELIELPVPDVAQTRGKLHPQLVEETTHEVRHGEVSGEGPTGRNATTGAAR